MVATRTKGENVCKELNTVLTKSLNGEVNSESKCLISQHQFFKNQSLVGARFLLYCHILWEYINSMLCAYLVTQLCLFVAPRNVAQDSLSMGFSRQEYCSG